MHKPLTWQCLPFEALSLQRLYDILQLRQTVFVVEQTCPYLDADGKDPQAFHLLGYDTHNQLQAYARILPPQASYPKDASIGRVVTAPHARGKGYGVQLMQTAITETERLFPTQTIRISAQAHLENFYTRLGFIPTLKRYLEDDIPHLEMWRPAQNP